MFAACQRPASQKVRKAPQSEVSKAAEIDIGRTFNEIWIGFLQDYHGIWKSRGRSK